MLINCVAYQNGIKLADLPVEQISDYLERKDCFVWVALRDTTNDELDKMQEEFGLHDLAIEDAHHGHQRGGSCGAASRGSGPMLCGRSRALPRARSPGGIYCSTVP